MARIAVDPARTYLLFNHGPVTLVSSAHGGRVNIMAASWAMPLDFDPPKAVVIIDRNTLTRELVDASGEFGLMIPSRALAAETVGVGSQSGRDIDKFAQFGLNTFAASKISAPLIEGCVAWMECKVLPERAVEQRYDLFVAEIVAAWADDRAFVNNRWRFDDPDLRTIHHVAGGSFFETGESLAVPGAED